MKLLNLMAGIAIIAAACNQQPSATGDYFKWVPDVKAENLKGDVEQLEINTYLIDSATGQMGKLETKAVEKFNKDGYVISYSEFSVKDSSTTVSAYDIDDKNYLRSLTSTKNGKPLSSFKIDIDSTGKATLGTSFDSTGKIDVFYDEIKMNEFGQLTYGKGHHADSTLKLTFVNNFDSIYYVGGESKDSVGKLTYSSTIQLDEKNNPLKMDETSVTKDSTTNTTTTYVYDKWDDKGNWTQRTVSENGKPKKIMVRTFTYKP